MKRKLTANILIFAIILMMIPIHTTLAEPEMTPLPTEEATEIAESAPTAMPAPELETQDPNISYAAPGEAPPVDYSMLDNYNNNYNSQYGQEPEEEPQEDIGLQNEGDVGVEDNTPSVNESGTENFEPTTFDSPYNQINNQNENITLNQGSLNISNTILSLPGKNGLDLTLNLSYNSGSAVLDSPLYYYPGSPGFNNYFRVATQNCFFAPGWELSKSYIEMYNMEDLYKPGTRAMTLHLADGRTYQIQNNGFGPEYEIYGCNTEDFKLEHFTVPISSYESTYHYLLTYKDGRTETFNWRGSLIQESDRFGNAINYSYEDEKLYRVNYKTYASNPAVYDRTFATLSTIQDSLGREIQIEREMQRDALGNSVQAVYFKMDGKNLAAAHFILFDSSYGPISVLSSFDTYAIDPSTNETKVLTTTYHYEEKIGAKTKDSIFYPGGNATIALTQIDYPTGAQTKYSYKNEKETTFDGAKYGQNESYKISSRWDIIDGEESGRKDYKYINNSSGYPSSHRTTNPYYNGRIDTAGFRYYTQVTEPIQDSDNSKTTLYTFNYEHLKINEETFADSNQIILPLEGAATNSKQVAVQNNGVIERYRAYLANYRLVIEKNSDTGNEVIDVINKGNSSIASTSSNSLVLRLYDVKSYQNYLLLFCGFGYGGYANEYAVIKYNVATRSYEFYATPNNASFSDSFIQSGNTFYNVQSAKIYAFDASANSWSTITSLPNNITSLRYILAEQNGTVYLSGAHSTSADDRLLKLENAQLSDLGSLTKNLKYGFANSQGFFVLGNKIQKYNGDGTFTDYIDWLTGVDTSSYPFINQNGEIYVIKKNDSYYEELYRLDFQNVKWVYVTTLLIKPYYFNALSDGTSIMLFSGNADTYSNGYEKINPYQINYANRTTTNLTYDEYKMPSSTSVTTYGPAGQKKTKTSAATYDGYKNLLSQTDALGRQNTYTYDTGTPGSGHYHILTQSVENVGTDKEITTTNTLSSDNKKITLSVTNYGANKLLHTKNEYSTTSPGNVIRQMAYETSENNPLNVTEYEYSADYNEAYVTKQTVKDAKVNSTDFTETTQSIATQSTYDSFGRVATSTDALGRVTSNVYYSNGWIKKATMPDGNFKEYTYQINANGVNKVTTNISGQYSTEDIYDNMGRMKEQKVPDTENVLQTAGIYAYDVNGKLYKQTDLYTQLTYTFDYLGRTVQLTTSKPDGTDPVSKSIFYDDFLQKQTVTDENGKSTMTYLDDAGRKTEDWQKQPVTENGTTTDQFVKVAAYTYDSADNVVSVTDANGNSITNSYDKQGNLLQITDAKDQSTTYAYDIKKNLLQMTTPGGSVFSYQYDDLNRVIKATDAVSESAYTVYDAAGRITKSKDRNGVITTNVYKENTDLIASTTSGDITTSFTYDVLGNIESTIDQTGTSIYTYYDNKKLESIIKPDGKYISYTYDVLGNVTSVTDYDVQTKYYTYEKGGRLKSISSSLTGTADVTYQYNDNGTLQQINYANGLETLYSYDSANRIAYMGSYFVSSPVYQYAYTYDAAGNQIKKVVTNQWNGTESKTSTYTYDELNRIQTETDPSGMVKSYAYDANNNIHTVTATAPSNAPTAAPILPQIQNPESTLPDDPLSASVNVEQNLNETSEISEAAQSVQNAGNTPENYVMTYTYDANNRLLTQKKAENGIDYLTKMGYDKNGNMTSRQRSSIGGPVGENTNMEISIGTMQSNPGSESVAETFSYNALNQMTDYQNSNGTNASYTYDATGMRTSKTVNGVEKKFYYNGMYILNEGDSAEINVTNFVGLTGIEGRQNGANEMAYFMKDAHGDVIKAMDSEDFRADYEYDIWGNQTQATTNTFDNPFRYCSEYMDEESGLIYLRARYYAPGTGRFTQEDPAMDGLNWYAYAGNNPIVYKDPSGMYQEGDENLPYLIQVIINGPDRRTGGLTAAYNNATSDEARQLIADTAEKLRSYDNVDFDMWNITKVMLINAEDGAGGFGHNALVLVDRYGNGAFFSFYPENNGLGALIGLENGELRFRTMSASVMANFLNSGTVSYLTASDSDTERENYNRYININISKDSGKQMLDRAVDMFVNPGKYGIVFAKQCDDVASMIMEAGNKKYFVHTAPNLSFEGVSRDWGLNINYMQ